MNLKYPIYIPSKGRHESRLTIKALNNMGVDYRVVVEPQEFEQYSKHIDNKNLLILPFSNLEQGSIPARNWIFEHSKKQGYKRHWIMDDNIEQFNRLNNNLQIKCNTGAIFRCVEDFVDRYKNIALAGLEYDFFVKSRCKWNPYRMNTRIYSCTLIDNSIPHRWRGKYNEDTDLSIRVLKDGYCTVLFLAFLQQKSQTQKIKGGNQKIYEETNQRKEFAESLAKQHPDVAKVAWRFGRWHHQVNYKPFKKNKLIRVDNYDEIVKDRVNEYGMKLITINK
jgi:hypothetical protein